MIASETPPAVGLFVDADGCPVKQEVYRVAARCGLHVTLVSNSRMNVPREDWLELVIVEEKFDAADDWIVEHVSAGDIVVTTDIPLAARCIKKDALVLSPTGHVFTEENIGDALGSREILAHLREQGMVTGGPAPFEKKDRSRFLQRLDDLVQAARRQKQRGAPASTSGPT